jgi:hypothetical protein
MERARERHGMTKTRTYRIWVSMLARCHNPNSYNRRNYGLKGVTVCDEWRSSFLAFLADMGEAPEGMTIERVDNVKGYCKENCKWATRVEQNNNRSDNRIVEHDGRSQTLAQWCRELGLNYYTVRDRLERGFTVVDAFSRGKFPSGPNRSKGHFK